MNLSIWKRSLFVSTLLIISAACEKEEEDTGIFGTYTGTEITYTSGARNTNGNWQTFESYDTNSAKTLVIKRLGDTALQMNDVVFPLDSVGEGFVYDKYNSSYVRHSFSFSGDSLIYKGTPRGSMTHFEERFFNGIKAD